MKKLKLKRGITVETEDDQWHEYNIDVLRQRMDDVGINKLITIEAAYDIENELERIIAFYFFGRHEINKEKSIAFTGQILNSNWCSFASKQSLIKFILDDCSVFSDNKQRDDYLKILKKIMSYRNAFTHGHLTSIGDKVKLTWFEGTTRTAFLTDDYFTVLEVDFTRCRELTEEVALKVGALTYAKSLENPLTAGEMFKIQMPKKDENV